MSEIIAFPRAAQSPRARAAADQAFAADPARSAWVSASAGSGKTRVLVERVLRLLLAGTPPERILCLTYTRAAAAEMATRLAARLGEWVVADDRTLTEALQRLTGRAPDEPARRAARELFARVLEQPGGMRIVTLHAFAQSLLGAFPLEAGLAPNFRVVDDADTLAWLSAAREAELAVAPEATMQALARLVPPSRFARLSRALAEDRGRIEPAVQQRQGLTPLLAALARVLQLSPDATTEDAVLAAAVEAVEAAPLLRVATLLAAGRDETNRKNAATLGAWLRREAPARAARWRDWRGLFLTQEGTPRVTRLVNKAGLAPAQHAELLGLMQDEAARVQAAEALRQAARVHGATEALLRLGLPILKRYAAAKLASGALDYDDLIERARQLLEDPGSAWVLHKLDGGIDHVLLDEAQDSNPAQWGILAALTGEFFAGAGARDGVRRTVFAVGDPKQSIFRFQGADAQGFRREGERYAALCATAGLPFEPVPFEVSFRSTAPVLALVDAVFAQPPASEGVVEAGVLRHQADRAGQAGSVELWPLLRPEPRDAPPDWAPPAGPVAAADPAHRLAAAVAERIRQMIAHETLPARAASGDAPGGPAAGRPIRAGDILVLVRSRPRGGFLAALARELKQRDVPVGGIDRLVLAEQLAVRDLLALAQVMLLPADDLTLAALLKSPLIGLEEDALTALAVPREGTLWAALARARGSRSPAGLAADWLAGWLDRADRITPHALFAAVLGEPGPFDERPGRARMLARLGPDAADPLNELLNAALADERRHPPSLAGFLDRLRRGEQVAKREGGAHGDAVRIMTAHGAKGLEAPIVFLPDTTGLPPARADLRWLEEADGPAAPLPAWAPRQEDFNPPQLGDARARDAEAEAREHRRLLYVALTRAEDRLMVCGWQGPNKPAATCWYSLVEAGFGRLTDAVDAPLDLPGFGADARMRQLTSRQAAGAALRREVEPPGAMPDVAVPDWARRPAPPEAPERSLQPSALPGEEETPAAAPHGATDPRGERFRRGRLVHALLQALPDHPAADRAAIGRRFLARPGHRLDPEAQAATLGEVLALLEAPGIAAAFGPGSLAEVPIAGRVAGRTIAGQVDRLLVSADRVLVLDYKTSRPPPAAAEAVAPLYLRQLAAYRAVLRQAFPGRAVDCALVWTWGARAMPLPGPLLDAHAPGAPDTGPDTGPA